MEDDDRYFDTGHLAADLKGRSVRGAAITLASQSSKFALRIAAIMVLARLLTPQDFGLIAMVAAVTGLIGMFRDPGLSMATIQRAEINHRQVSTLFWVNAALGGTMMILLAAIAPGIAWFYGEPRLINVTFVIALGFMFGGLAVQHQALLRRQMRFGALAAVEVVSELVGVATGILLALAGAGYWALALMIPTSEIATAAGVWMASGWIPGLPVRYSGVRRMLAFGGNLTGFNFLNYFARNLDKVLIGRVWGAGALGFYSRAYSLLLLPLMQINSPITSVVIPGLSSLNRNPQRFRSYYLKALSLAIFATAPLCVFLFLFSDEIIRTFLGSQWMPASRVFRFLAISALIQPVFNSSGWLFISTGRTDRMLKWGAVGTALIVASFIVGLPGGGEGVALSYSLAILLWTWPWMYIATRSTEISLHDIVKTMAPSVISAVCAGAFVSVVKGLAGTQTSDLKILGLCAAVTCASYFLMLSYVFRLGGYYLSVLTELQVSRQGQVPAR